MAASIEIGEFLKFSNGIGQASFPDEDERHKAIRAARQMLSRLEKPWDTLLHLTWGVPTTLASLKTCVDLGIFKFLDDHEGAPKTSEELAKAAGADATLVDRIMRNLAANDLVDETGSSTWGPTDFTREIAQGLGASALNVFQTYVAPCCINLPEYLQKTQYKLPTDVMDGNWQHAKKTHRPPFGPDGYLAHNPIEGQQFGELMAGYTSQRKTWVEVFPTSQLFDGDSENSDEQLVVDVGGNWGEDLLHLIAKHPDAKGRLVLQDIEPVIAAAQIPDGIKRMAHDFFTPQPVRNARAYFFHSVFHDWPEVECLKILQALRPAMGPRSRLLISENVIQDTGALSHQTSLDIIMMAAGSATERTEIMWQDMLSKSGFKIVNIYPSRLESVIEAVAV